MLNLALYLLPAVVAAAQPSPIPKTWSARERAAATAISAASLAAHVRFLSDDLLEGRAPASRGERLAMRYVAATFERLGLTPAGDGDGYFQKFQVVELKTDVTSPPVVRGRAGAALVLRPLTDAIVGPGSQRPATEVRDAEVVFVGYGITAPEQQWDDFKDVDVRGKVLLVMNSDPADEPLLFAGKTRLYYGRWSYKYEEAARRGAAGVIIIHTTDSAGYPWQVVQSSWGREQFELPSLPGEPDLAVKMWATEEASRKLAALGGQDLDALRRSAERRDFRPVALGVKLSVSLRTQIRRLDTGNVLGLLPGSDPHLARELVVVTAHHDHLGIGAPKDGDAIYNGAVDNASGVAALLALAESAASARPRPKRSMLFASVGGEESGLLGSAFFCAHPTAPAGRLAADLNIDGINIMGRTRDVTFTGLGKSSLDQVVKAAAQQQGRSVEPDQFPERGHFYRSDQFSFARIGVPSVYLNAGTDVVGHDRGWGRERIEEYTRLHYHQPSDQIGPSWDLSGAVDDVRLLLVVGLRIADAAALPAWLPGDEFEHARKAALADPTLHYP